MKNTLIRICLNYNSGSCRWIDTCLLLFAKGFTRFFTIRNNKIGMINRIKIIDKIKMIRKDSFRFNNFISCLNAIILGY
jgi:hypothetical protein